MTHATHVSQPLMLDWQWRQLLVELDQIQRHAADPSCPCGLADIGEFCLAKHALALHGLAAETFPMLPPGPDIAMLQELEEEALEWHAKVKQGLCTPPVARDEMLAWARNWRKRIEPAYYTCTLKKRQAHAHAPTPAPRNGEDLGNRSGHTHRPPAQGTLAHGLLSSSHGAKAGHVHAPTPPAAAPAGVCSAIREARSIHQDYLGLPPDSKTGSHDWHKHWVHVYDDTLGALKCSARPPTPPPVPPPEEGPGLESLKEQVTTSPCLLRLTKRDQKRVSALAGVYLAGGNLLPRDYLELADYVACLSSHHTMPAEMEALGSLAQQLQGASCLGVHPTTAVSPTPTDIARLPLDLIDVRPEKYQYRRGGAEQVGLDTKHVQNIVDTFDPERMTPIEVRPVDGRYDLLSGHHRLAAFKRAREMGGFPSRADYDVTTIPSLVRRVDEATARELARLSNAQTKEYTPSEFAKIVEVEYSLGASGEAIARKYGNRKLSEIEKFRDVALLPDALLNILDQPAMRKAFSLDHAAVLGHAMRAYGLSADEVSTIFHRVLKEGEYTATQLERMLATLGTQLQAAPVDMFAGMEVGGGGKTGILDAMKRVMDEIGQQARQRRQLRGFSNFIDAKRKAGETVPDELANAYASVQAEIAASERRMEELRAGIGEQLKAQPAKLRPALAPTPPQPRSLAALVDKIEARAQKHGPWEYLKTVDFCNVSTEDREAAWGFKPLREALVLASARADNVQLCSVGFGGEQYQLTISYKDRMEIQPIKASLEARLKGYAKEVHTPYRQLVYLVTLPSTEVHAEDLLGGKQYVPEPVVRGERGQQLGLLPLTPQPPSPIATKAGKLTHRIVDTFLGDDGFGPKSYDIVENSYPNGTVTYGLIRQGEKGSLISHARSVESVKNALPGLSIKLVPPAPAPGLHACVLKIKAEQHCPESEWGSSKGCVNPYAVCQAAMRP